VGGGGGKFLDVMGDEDDGRGVCAVLEEGLDGGEDLFTGEEVEAGGGFI
jgi:hypothetical protein